MLHRPTVELLYFDSCPSYRQLLPGVEHLAGEAGASLQLRQVETAEAAEREGFLGSPTVRVDGVDVDPAAVDRTDFGLTCRVYRSEGAPLPVPPDAWIRVALRRSTAQQTGGVLSP